MGRSAWIRAAWPAFPHPHPTSSPGRERKELSRGYRNRSVARVPELDIAVNGLRMASIGLGAGCVGWLDAPRTFPRYGARSEA